MPFGKFRGTPMMDVDVSYLNFLWNNGLKTEKKPVANYIRRCLNALKQENPDLIWDK